ncbi:MAG: hypothetical protein R3C11_13570 [Planctomycetaceae bacterium]
MSAIASANSTVESESSMQQLTERMLDWNREEVNIDRAQRLVRNVALAGRISRNGYEYESEALREAVSLYAGKPVFLDHAGQRSRPQERSARDLIGSVENVVYVDERVRGDIRVLDTESGRTFLALAESDADVIGMSHVVLAERTADRKRVLKIHEVISVDAVVYPATTSSLREGVSMELSEGEGEVDLSVVVKRLQREADELRIELAETQAELDRRLQEVEVAKELQLVGLPQEAMSEVFQEQLIETADAAERGELIRERLELWKRAHRREPSSSSRLREVNSTIDDEFVRLVRAA